MTPALLGEIEGLVRTIAANPRIATPFFEDAVLGTDRRLFGVEYEQRSSPPLVLPGFWGKSLKSRIRLLPSQAASAPSLYFAKRTCHRIQTMARVPKEPPRPEPVEIKINGTLFSGTYTVDRDGIVTVRCTFGSKSAHNGSISPQHFAKHLLGELIPASAYLN
jgi:hypothetical protein